MGDLRRERDTARNERDQLRRENQNLRNILGEIDPHYADAYATLCDLALNGTRGDNPKLSPTFESQPPRRNPIAYHLRNEERRNQRQRATRLQAHIEHLTDGGPRVVPPTTSTPLAQPSRNYRSVDSTVVRYSQWRFCAPNGAANNFPED